MARYVNIKRDELIYCGTDGWSRPTWKYHNMYLKDVNLKGTEENIPNILYDTANGEFDGEPNNCYNIILI